MTWVLPASLASRKVFAEMMVLYTLHISTWVLSRFPLDLSSYPFTFHTTILGNTGKGVVFQVSQSCLALRVVHSVFFRAFLD